MRAQKQQQKQALGGTLKAFVRVGKATDAPAGKPATAAVRMTRSKSAAAAAVEKTEAAKAKTQPKTMTAVKADGATAAGGKRKLAAESETPAAETPAPKRRVAERRKTTTIDAYFAPAVAETTAEEAAPEVVEPAEEVAEEPAAKAAEEAERCSERDARATALLGRLRARHRAAARAADSAAAGGSALDTREIQEALRTRRHADTAAEAAPAPAPAPATFSLARVASETHEHQREQRRQFVPIPLPTTRPLPRSFSKLTALFQALEHTLLFAPQHAVQKGVVYHRVRKSVEVMARWTFGWKELGQILAVFPEAYVCERTETVVAGRTVASVAIRPGGVAGVRLAVEMEQRRGEFARRLERLVDAAYGAFLARRGYAHEEAEDVSHAQWHPEFDVEDTPEVAPVVMPPPMQQPPAFDRERLRHLLGKADAAKPAEPADAAKPAEPVKPAEPKPAEPASVALPTPTDSPVLTPNAEPSSSSSAKPKPSGSAAASALLARIRAKQQAKAASTQTVGRATHAMHSRLPGVVEAVSFMFYAERKSSLPFALVADKIAEARGLDLREAAGHLLALARLVPEWCAVLDEKGEKLDGPAEAPLGARLKITRAISMQEAKARLAAKLASGAM
ncbi:hypothetical protein GGI15_001643 [Coemansia interrupta]|uniref:CDT1 Geminin-binding domain-containing protein n=1 Tax=Coemansia interrupta TaxID=1126814 RepID=A0A9W8LNP0_9FUNG|nr:hypothetical protein GGI15_001643 [Coemansia interrupta]